MKRIKLTMILTVMTALAILSVPAFAEDTENVPVTGLTLDQTEITLQEGESISVAALTEPENATNPVVLWLSNDEGIAAVDEGLITGVSAGRTQVTASTEDGALTARCNVTVEALSESEDADLESDGEEGEILPTPEDQSPKDLQDCRIEAIKAQGYTGRQITPELIVTYEDTPLVKGSDYTATYFNNTNAGTATAVIEGIGSWTGSASVEFLITPAVIKTAALSTTTYTYNNAVKTPAVSVTGSVSGKNLIKGTDYTVKYAAGRKAVGKYTVTVTGKGNYSGTIKKSFTIKPAKLKSAKLSTASYTYNKKAKTPGVSVLGSVHKTKLKKGTDFTVKYAAGRKAVGKYTVTIKGKGNYAGTIKKTFTVKPAKAVTSSVRISSGKMTVIAKSKASAYGGTRLQIAYKPAGGKWKYVITTTKSKTIKVADSKKYSVKVRAYKKVGKTNYYGAWSKTCASVRVVKVKFNANKGKVSPGTKRIWSSGKYGKMPTPKRSGYKFRGWYTRKSGGTRVTATTASLAYRDHTLYAHWFGPKGKGGTITRAEYDRIGYGMSYDDVCYLIGGYGDRVSAYEDEDYIERSHEEWVDTGYWDYDYDEDGYERSYWVEDGYWDTVDDSYFEPHYYETYSFNGSRSGWVDLEFKDGYLHEIYTYSFK